MQKYRALAPIAALLCVLCAPQAMHAMHNTNRWFPLIERAEPVTLPPIGKLNVDLFLTQAATTFDKEVPGVGGIPELWGQYDLDLIIKSAQKAAEGTDCPLENPLCCVRPDWANVPLIYDVRGKIKSKGVIFQYTQNLQWAGLAAGFYLPYMEVRSSARYRFNPGPPGGVFNGLTQAQIEQLDDIRRSVHEQIGLEASDYREWNFGDLDVYLRKYHKRDYILNMRAVHLNFALGAVLPTSKERNINNAASIPFGNNGSTAFYGDVWLEFQPRADWHVGFIAAFNGQTSHTHRERIPVCCRDITLDASRNIHETVTEPLPYSSIIGDLRRRPGLTQKFQAYFGMDHVTDGLSFLVRYTRIRHHRDKLTDARPDAEQGATSSQLEKQEDLTRWYATFLTLHATYDTKDTGQHWPGTPRFYAVWDFPTERLGGDRAVKTHQLTLGVAFNF